MCPRRAGLTASLVTRGCRAGVRARLKHVVAFVPEASAPFPKVLQMNGYSTAAFGKWHLTPDGQQGAAGPFNRWPNAWGFDYFWGFQGGESGQWDPVITENTQGDRRAAGPGRQAVLLPPMIWRTRRSSGCTRSALRTRPSRGSCISVPGVLTRRTRCRGSGPPSTAGGSTAAGMRTGRRSCWPG